VTHWKDLTWRELYTYLLSKLESKLTSVVLKKLEGIVIKRGSTIRGCRDIIFLKKVGGVVSAELLDTTIKLANPGYWLWFKKDPYNYKVEPFDPKRCNGRYWEIYSLNKRGHLEKFCMFPQTYDKLGKLQKDSMIHNWHLDLARTNPRIVLLRLQGINYSIRV
jgi:hypothetical protein